MKMIAAALAAIALAGCQTTSGTTANVYKAEIAAEAAFNAAVTAEHTAKASGLLAGANAAKGDALVSQAYVALKVARTTADAGAEPDVTNIIALVNQITALSGAK